MDDKNRGIGPFYYYGDEDSTLKDIAINIIVSQVVRAGELSLRDIVLEKQNDITYKMVTAKDSKEWEELKLEYERTKAIDLRKITLGELVKEFSLTATLRLEREMQQAYKEIIAKGDK